MAAGFSIFTLMGSILIDSDEANKSINKTEKNAESMASKLGNGIKTVGALGLVVGGAAVAAGGALLALATKTANSADEIDKLSERTGINREELQRWKYAAEQSGADIGKLEVGMKTLSDAMDNASNGSKKSVEAFDKLGISVDDLKNKSQSDIFDDVMNALAEMPEGAERNALGNDVLGKSYTELMPLLNAGAEGMDALKTRAGELGLVMSEDAVKANVIFGDSMADVKGAFGAVFMQLSNDFLPILQSFLDWVLGHMPEIQSVISVVFGVVSKVTEVAFRWFNDYLLPVFEDLFSWVKTNMPQIRSVFETVWDAISTAVEIAIGIITGVIDTFIGFFTGDWSRMADGIKAVWSGMWDGIKYLVEGAWNLLSGAFSILWDGISGWFINLGEDALQWGKDMVQGLWDGIVGKSEWLLGKVGEWADSVSGAFKNFFGIASPSKLMAEYGKNIDEGLAEGIIDNEDIPISVIAALGEKMSEAARKAYLGAMQILSTPMGMGEKSNRASSMNDLLKNGIITAESMKNAGTNILDFIDGGYNKSQNTVSEMNQTYNIYSPTALSPSEVARQVKNASREIAMGV